MPNLNSQQLLVIIAPSDLKDDLVDQLMSLDFISGFNLITIDGYSRAHSQFDIAEQVKGYRKLYRFEVLHQPQQKQSILNALAKSTARESVRYWIVPVLEQGHF
ncbi:MAG: DUF3240 family protein [Enterobacterales bacterium]|nr:DUF3240 family protein [Enterobacterales bacterium]